jgi:hypothetical protein
MYRDVVKSDAPQNWWRFNDQGVEIIHDYGSVAAYLMGLTPANTTPNYSGIALDGGAMAISGAASASTYQFTVNLFAPCSLEIWQWPGRPNSTFTFGRPPNQIDLKQQGAPSNSVSMIVNNTAIAGGTYVANIANWVHLLGTWDGTTVILYINGVLFASIASGVYTPPGGVVCGLTQTQGQVLVTEAAIYPTVLSAARAAAHYAAADSLAVPVLRNKLASACQ